MKLWVKETEPTLIELGAEAGIVEGVMMESSSSEYSIASLLEVQSGPVAIPLQGNDEETILGEAQELFQLSNRILPILTFRTDLLPTFHHLFRLGIDIACKIKTPLEGWLASKAGATLLLSKPLSFAFLDPKRWRRGGNERDVPLFLEVEESMEILFTAPVGVEGAIIPSSILKSLVRPRALAAV